MRAAILCLFFLPLLAFCPESGSAADRVGVVLMHGKRGNAGPGTLIGPLETALREAGAAVVAPEMPWSQGRFLDRTFEGVLAEIDAAVAELRRQGVTKIVVGGHSLGGNAALAYGARRDGIAGILVIAPGHFPESRGFRKRFAEDLARARALIGAGEGETPERFGDIDPGKSAEFTLMPVVYLDFMDPEGPFAMPLNAARLKPGTALMLIIGEKDLSFEYGRGDRSYIFDHAPADSGSRYEVVSGGHKVTPRIGAAAIVEWVLSR